MKLESKKGIISCMSIVLILCFLSCEVFFTIKPMVEGKENNLYSSFESGGKGITFLIGESELISEKNKRSKCEILKKRSSVLMYLENTSFDFEKIKQKIGEKIFKATETKVSNAKITYLNNERIKSLTIEDELIIHSIEKAGKESKYDFYAGTYDNGYLIGGVIKDGEIKYEIIEQIDDRIREMEVADVDRDGLNEVLVATHYDGITGIFYPDENWRLEILDKNHYGENNTFNHKVEVGDVTGDGLVDVVSTPSQPNTWDEEQKGVIKLFERRDEEWKIHKTEELKNGHIRKVVLFPEDKSIIGGVGQRDKPKKRKASLVKYQFVNQSLEKVEETFFSEAKHNFYPFIVEIKGRKLVIGLSSNGFACAVNPKTMEKVFVDKFSDSFEAFYTAEVFDYNSDGIEEIAIVHDGSLSIYSISEKGLEEIRRIDIYKNFDSTIIWSVESLRK